MSTTTTNLDVLRQAFVAVGARDADSYVGLWQFTEGRIRSAREWYDAVVAAEAAADLDR